MLKTAVRGLFKSLYVAWDLDIMIISTLLVMFSAKVFNYNNNKSTYFLTISLNQSNLVEHLPFKSYQLTCHFLLIK